MTDYTEDEQKLIDATEWPTTADLATADAMIVHGARLAMTMQADTDILSKRYFRMDRSDPGHRDAARAYMQSVVHMIAEAQVTIAIAKVQEKDRAAADELARTLWIYTEDGGLLHELMFDYLQDRGVDAQAMWDLAERSAS